MSARWIFAIGMIVVLGGSAAIQAQEGSVGRSEATALGPHGGKLLGSESDGVEVKVDPSQEKVEVFLLGKSSRSAKDLSMKLFATSKPPLDVELHAVTAPGGTPADGTPHFQGSLDPRTAPWSGFELRIRKGGERAKTFRSSF